MKLFKRKKELAVGGETFFWQKSYSQDGEDVVLNAYFSDFPEYKGFYLDIGALHPLRFSNTQLFYEKGWRGINIDATPGSMSEFEKIRPEDINLECGISNIEGELTYYLFKEPALNSFNKEISDERIASGWELQEEIRIKTIPINRILNKYLKSEQKIDFINIDVEGFDYDIVKSLDFEKYAPKYFLIEELDYVNNDFVNYQHTKMYKLLEEKGYKVLAKTMRTIIFGLK